MPDTLLEWIGAILLLLCSYELLRWVLVRSIRTWLQSGALRFVRKHRVRLESARFVDRIWLRISLMQDPEVDAAIFERSRIEGKRPAELRNRAEKYINEMAPAFSITAYYRIGNLLARAVMGFCYELVFDRNSWRRVMEKLPPGAVPVFLPNHRSNIDSVVLSYGLMRNVALTYAVGEWALVWPLDRLFKAFGSYFVRRGEKDPLYHKILERFVQRLVGNGGVTGFFLEGRLSRDGRIGIAKAGLLDFILGVRRDHPDLDLWFVPVGVNYDRVIEDRNMVADASGPRRPSFLQRAQTVLRISLRLPILLLDNGLALVTGAHRKFGYAAVVVGAPIRFSELEGARDLPNLPKEQRREQVDALAQQILRRSESLVPVTPVPLFCSALLAGGNLRLTEVTRRVHSRLQVLERGDANLALGKAFQGPQSRDEDASGIPGLDEALISLSDAEMITTLAGHALARRRLVKLVNGVFRVRDGAEPLLRFYANSIAHHLEEGGEDRLSTKPGGVEDG